MSEENKNMEQKDSSVNPEDKAAETAVNTPAAEAQANTAPVQPQQTVNTAAAAQSQPADTATQQTVNSTPVQPAQTAQPQNNAYSNGQTFAPNNGNGGNNNVPPYMTQQMAGRKPRRKRNIPWKPILKYAAVFVVAAACGFGGGVAANYWNQSNTETTQQTMTQGGFPGNGQSGTQTMPGNGQSGNDTTNGSSSTSSTVAMGVYVETQDDGLYVAGFSDGSKAETDGLAAGDKIVSIDGNEFTSATEISTYIQTLSAGDKVKVVVERDGSDKTVEVELITSSSSSSSDGQSGATATPSSTQSSDDSLNA
jgi:hypothetical protein